MASDLDSSSSFDSSVQRFKVSLIGDMGVGKTCVSLRFVRGLFQEDYKATISDIETKAIYLNKDRIIFQIWDTGGQERFRSLLPLYLKGINGAIVVYDVTEKASFDHVENWIADVRKYADDDTIILLIGNKVDLVNDCIKEREVLEKDGQEKASSMNLLFIETSAKVGHNVHEAFITLGEAMLQQHRIRESALSLNERCKQPSVERTKKSGCC